MLERIAVFYYGRLIVQQMLFPLKGISEGVHGVSLAMGQMRLRQGFL